MVALETPEAEIGTKAPDFALPGTDDRMHTLESLSAGFQGLLVMFICNHCPFVQSRIDRIISDAKVLQEADVAVVAISSNDADNYPEDGFDKMKQWAEAKAFPFPYLYDESQEVAKGYGAVCTPDFFGYNANLELQFRGRIDNTTGMNAHEGEKELLPAMLDIARGGTTSRIQHPSVGCSIKWKAA